MEDLDPPEPRGPKSGHALFVAVLIVALVIVLNVGAQLVTRTTPGALPSLPKPSARTDRTDVMSDALTALFAFLGAAAGSVLPFLASRASTKQEGAQGRREEWGRRFTAALEALTSADAQ